MFSGDTDDTEAQWLQYVSSLQYFDAFAVDAPARIDQLHRLSKVLFSNTTHLKVLEKSEKSEIVHTSIQDEDAFDAFANRESKSQVEVVSIHQQHSLSPLNISKSSFFKLIQKNQVSPDFLDVICSFGDKKLSSDESLVAGAHNIYDGSCYDIFYQILYMEKNKRSRGNPWSLRQTGVYHKHSGTGSSTSRDTWILLHPIPSSKLHKRLEKLTSSDFGVKSQEYDPLRLHLLIISSYLDGWRLYFHDMTRQFLELEDCLMTSELHDREKYTVLNFDTLQTLRHMAGKLIPIPAILEASRKTIMVLKKMNSISMSQRQNVNSTTQSPTAISWLDSQLSAYENRLESYLSSCVVLQARIENMTKFLADGLNLQNQEISTESNGHLVTLTKKTVADSATVRAVTIVTLIYLPATFVSGVFGSNLFAFSPDTTDFEISRQFWIYFAAVIPLTALTLGYWAYKNYQQRKQREMEAAAAIIGDV